MEKENLTHKLERLAIYGPNAQHVTHVFAFNDAENSGLAEDLAREIRGTVGESEFMAKYFTKEELSNMIPQWYHLDIYAWQNSGWVKVEGRIDDSLPIEPDRAPCLIAPFLHSHGAQDGRRFSMTVDAHFLAQPEHD